MQKLYQKIKIDNFEKIQEELLSLVPEDKQNLEGHFESWIVDIPWLLSNCPTLDRFLKERALKPVDQIKFYSSGPDHGTGHHVDGTIKRQPFGLTLPLKNTSNSFLNWYQEDSENFIIRNLIDQPIDGFECVLPKVLSVKDTSKLKLIDSIEVTGPTFTKSDVMHNVNNTSGGTRIVCVIRWLSFYQNVSDVLDTSGIEIE
jgi:hypothetical protein